MEIVKQLQTQEDAAASYSESAATAFEVVDKKLAGLVEDNPALVPSRGFVQRHLAVADDFKDW